MWQQTELSYCSNLHPGESLSAVIENVRRYFVPVRQTRKLSHMSSGLWLSAAAARDLTTSTARANFRQTLNKFGLRLTSLNGFPYGNFHAKVVKQSVYLPNWSQPERLTYTQHLADILAHCLPQDEAFGSISTLPVGYGDDMDEVAKQQAITNLLHMEHYLAQLKQKTGKKILLCLEMEPDCMLEKTNELIGFFQQLELQRGSKLKHLAICFDICHQGVMFEDIYLSLVQITEAGIQIGKIQVSNAIEVDVQAARSAQELKQILDPFAADKFLHQVKALGPKGALLRSPDLIQALGKLGEADSILAQSQQARIHFHIPLHAQTFVSPLIKSLHQELEATWQFLSDYQHSVKPHLEVETYTWQVLPKEMQPTTDEQLVQGICQEFEWLEAALSARGILEEPRLDQRTPA